MTAKIGLIGVGRMGMPILANLVRAGFEVLATDLRREQEPDVRAAGAGWVDESRRVAAAADVLITVLPGSEELRETMNVAIAELSSGSSWIDMTSASPMLALDLMHRASERGVACLDAPIGGGIAAARTGSLHLFVGGSAEALTRNRDLLEVLGTVDHVGEQGAGYTTKLLVNLLWFGQAIAVAEAMLLARRAGIDLATLQSVLADSAAASNFIRNDLDALLDGNYLAVFGLDRCSEELDAVVAMSQEYSVPFELSSLVADTYRRALARYGPADGELLAVAMLEERAGVKLRWRDAH